MRVGRDALDAEAMQLLEQHNPDVVFDWARLLKSGSAASPGSTGPSPVPPRDERRRDRRDRRGRTVEGGAPAPAAEFTRAADAVERADVADAAYAAPGADPNEPAEDAAAAEVTERADFTDPAGLANRPPLGDATDGTAGRDFNQDAELAARPAPAPDPVDPRYTRLGADGLRRLRVRYADLRGRIEARPLDDPGGGDRVELLAKVERLNPDAWQTEEEVTHALEEYEVVFETLRSLVGRQPRSRRL